MKKFLCLLLSVLMIAGAFSLSAFAADSVVYIAYNGSDDNDGLSATTPKGKLGTLSGSGAIGMLKNGGTLVVSQKLLIGSVGGKGYTWDVPGAVTITGNYGGVDYKNPAPANNPASGMMKFTSGNTMTVKSDLTIDDIILFQELDQNTIIVESGGSLTITDKVICMSAKPYYINIEVEAGGKAVINGGIYSNISGAGDIRIAEGVQVLGAEQKPEEKPAEGNADVAFINFATGSDGNSGTSADYPKKQFGKTDGSGVMSLLASGGTMVVTGKAYIGGTAYEFPAMSDVLTITSNYGGVDYKKATPENNPDCAFKMAGGATLVVNSDVVFDDVILFQENAQNTIKVNSGATLVITDKTVILTKPGNDYHYKIVIEPGATAILSEAAQKAMTIENNGTLLPYESDEPATPDAKFTASRTYQNQFTDVAANQWFYSFVKTAFEYTLANGTSDTKFSPDGKFTVAQALTAAVNIHKAYNGTTVRAAAAGEAWYVPYVEYCVANGIIKDGQFADLNANIKRGDMAIVFANILPESEYKAIRTKTLPDMTAGMASAAAVQKLANAGIVGGDAKGNFNPDNEITRAEACVIFTRIAVADMRDAK